MVDIPDSTDGIPNLFPRQSVPDEDYDGSVFDLNPVSQTLRTPQQTEHKADHDELKASNSLKPQLPEETAPANYQLYKTPVQAEPDDKSDVYFIGKSVVFLWFYYHCEWKFTSENIES